MIKEQIYEILSLMLEDIEIDDGTMLLDEGLLDSIGILYLVSELEEKNGIKIPLDGITEDHFKNIESIKSYIEELLGKTK